MRRRISSTRRRFARDSGRSEKCAALVLGMPNGTALVTTQLKRFPPALHSAVGLAFWTRAAGPLGSVRPAEAEAQVVDRDHVSSGWPGRRASRRWRVWSLDPSWWRCWQQLDAHRHWRQVAGRRWLRFSKRRLRREELAVVDDNGAPRCRLSRAMVEAVAIPPLNQPRQSFRSQVEAARPAVEA